MIQQLSYFIYGFIAGSGIIGYFLKHPETVEKWASMIAWALSRIWKKTEYFAIKSELQGRINSFVRTLESNTTAKFPRVSIKWTGRDKEEIIWEDGETIIVMRDRRNKTKNFVHATYFFTSEALLRKSKRHLSKGQKLSLDLFATKKVLEAESKSSVEQFMNDYFIPEIERQEIIRNLIQQYVRIDRIGVFFPVLIQELSHLGNKVFLSKPTSEVIEEVKSFVNFLEKFSQREVGDIKIPDTFIGKYSRCAIKIIASRPVREIGDISSNKERVSNAIKQGVENVYIIGSAGAENKQFINRVSKAILEEYNYVEFIRSYQFKGQIKIRGKLIKVDTYLVYLHNPTAVKYLYEQNEIESLVNL